MPPLYEKLTTKLAACHSRDNVAFIVGGSKDLNQSILKTGVRCVVFSINDEYVESLKGTRFDPEVNYFTGEGRLHVAIDLESVREAAGVTSLKPEAQVS